MSLVLGLPPLVNTFDGIDTLGIGCKIAENVTILRHGERFGPLVALGEGVSLFDGVRLIMGDVSINRDARLQIGARSIVNVGCYLSGEGGLTIGEEVLIGPHVKIFSAGHAVHGGETSIYRNQLTYSAVQIGDGAWIGGGASVLPGTIIGRGAVVGAGSVVTKDVAPFAVVAGNPARLLHYRDGYLSPESPWQKLRNWVRS
jgi:acetyltransferase-like isoleucine patch superfamily enzyme